MNNLIIVNQLIYALHANIGVNLLVCHKFNYSASLLVKLNDVDFLKGSCNSPVENGVLECICQCADHKCINHTPVSQQFREPIMKQNIAFL